MSIVGQCPNCSRKFNAPDHLLGKTVPCPQCSRPFVVQAAQAAAAASQNNGGFADFSPSGRDKQSKKMPLLVALSAAAVLLLVLGAVGLVWAFSGTTQAQWKEFAPTDGGFSVMMPVTPEQKDGSDPKVTSASKMREATAQVAGSKVSYSVSYYDLSDRPHPYLYPTWLLKYHLPASGGKLVGDLKDVAQGEYTGKEVTVVDLPDDQVLVRRIYLAEARVFWLTARYPRAPMPPTDVEKFLGSFKITSVAKLPPSTLVAQLPSPPTTGSAVPPPPLPPSPPTTPGPRPMPPTPTQPAPPPPAPPMPPAPVGNLSADEQALLDALNRFRANEKLQPFQPMPKLFEAARAYGTAMIEKKLPPDFDATGYRSVNTLSIAAGGLTPQQIADRLTESFRPALTADRPTDIGLAIVADPKGINRYILVLGSK